MSGFAKAFLHSLVNFETQTLSAYNFSFDLRRIQRLLAALDSPQKKYPIIHIVGTKGKGSTAAFIAFMLRAAGLKVGLYTSPHLYDEKERIRILAPGKNANRKNIFEGKISARQLENVLRKIKHLAKRLSRQKGAGEYTYFEILTAAAFLFFAEQKVDVVVAEVGLGGRLDATNAGRSDICVVTPISYDHTKVLGKTLGKIAWEKAAVIKPSTEIVFSAPQKKDTRRAILKQTKKYKKTILTVGKEIRYKNLSCSIRGESFSLKTPFSNRPRLKILFLGSHQVINASLAVAVVEYFLKTRGIGAQKAIAQGLTEARWPGRFEIVHSKPFVIVDSAHNLDSVQKLLSALKRIFPQKKVIVIFGASRDKDVKGMLWQFQKVSDAVVLTKTDHPRSFDFLKEKITGGDHKKFVITKNSAQALKAARTLVKKNDIVLAAGSVFLAAEIRKLCKPTI